MQMGAGVVLILASSSMIYFARSRDGEPRPFLRNWLLAQFYALFCMLVGILGCAAIILGWSAPT
jgi:hypothetical protein